MEEYMKLRFTVEDPKFLANNFLKNFGQMYQNGETTFDFFNDAATSAGGQQY